MSLERQYRHLSRWFPADWRARNEEEFIATLLDGAEPGRDSVSLAEAVDLVRGAMVLRSRALFAQPRRAGGGRSARRFGLVGLALFSACAVVMVVRSWISDISVEFLLTSLIVVAVPGTGVFYTVSSSIGGGWRRGFFAAIGCTFGIVPHVVAAMLGLSGVMQAGSVAFEAVRWAGVAYLVVMGVSMIRHGGALRFDPASTASIEPIALVVRRGILLNLLNPKLTVFFFAFLPQFLPSPPGLLDPRLIGLGGVFMLMTFAVFVVYAWASAAVRDRVLGAPVVLRWVQRSLGTLLIGVAARLAVTDR
ncbi:LysE family translocator [Iamia sp.]|uniref:LysE family translocator n=1 Tax=Iamia sp. TaxID=2722710 RepID=UPI002BC04EE0|nr:LysE family translocator [Iamia sp.]HXH55972.1 LysE family translocator [Iamia sp.]